MVNNKNDGLSDYGEKIKEAGKKGIAVLTTSVLLGVSTVTGYAADPSDFVMQDEKVRTYAEKHIDKEEHETFQNLYHMLEEGLAAGDKYGMERYEMMVENLVDMHAEGDKDLYLEKIKDLKPHIADLFYGDQDGEIDEEEYNKLLENHRDNRAFKTIKDKVNKKKVFNFLIDSLENYEDKSEKFQDETGLMIDLDRLAAEISYEDITETSIDDRAELAKIIKESKDDLFEYIEENDLSEDNFALTAFDMFIARHGE